MNTPDETPDLTETERRAAAGDDQALDALHETELTDGTPEELIGRDPHPGDHVLEITKPGLPAVQFGPMSEQAASEWRSRLMATFHSAAHPEGVQVEVTDDYRPDKYPYIDPYGIPGHVDDLMPAFHADTGYTDEGYPDIYLRLLMRWGDTRANDLWTQACHLADEEAAYEEAAAAITTAAANACARIGLALPEAEKAAGEVYRMLTTGDRFDIGVPAAVAAYPADAAVHLADALRSLRAANLALRPMAAEG